MLVKYYLVYAIKYVKEAEKEEIEWRQYVNKLREKGDI